MSEAPRRPGLADRVNASNERDARSGRERDTEDASAVDTSRTSETGPVPQRIPVHERNLPGNPGYAARLWGRVQLYGIQKGAQTVGKIPTLLAHHAEAKKVLADSKLSIREAQRNQLRTEGRKNARELQRLSRSGRRNGGLVQNFINRQKIRFILVKEVGRRTKESWITSSFEKAKGKQEKANSRLARAETRREEAMQPFLDKLDERLGRIDPALNEINTDVTARETRLRSATERASTLRAQCEAFEAEIEAYAMDDTQYAQCTQQLDTLWAHANDAQAVADEMKEEYTTICDHRERMTDAHRSILVARRKIAGGYDASSTAQGERLPTEQPHLDRLNQAHGAARETLSAAELKGNSFDYGSAIRDTRQRLAEENKSLEFSPDQILSAWNRFIHDDAGQIQDIRAIPTAVGGSPSSAEAVTLQRMRAGQAVNLGQFENLIRMYVRATPNFAQGLDRCLGDSENVDDLITRFTAIAPGYPNA